MTTENDKIERSTGKCVGGYRVGGGYRGKREDQDEAVQEFARRLADEFPHDIQIRYNTNRLGGGAWLVDNAGNNQIGLGAELKAPEWHKEEVQEWLDSGLEDGEKPTELDRMDPNELNLRFSVHVVVPAIPEELAEKESAFNGKNDYTHRLFDDFETAWSWFMENVNRDEVNPPAEE